jgi:hypothetical protein
MRPRISFERYRSKRHPKAVWTGCVGLRKIEQVDTCFRVIVSTKGGSWILRNKPLK